MMDAKLEESFKGCDLRIIDVWAVHQNAGERAAGEPAWIFHTKQAAKHAARGRGWFGGDATITTHKALIFPDLSLRLLDYRWFTLNEGPDTLEEVKQKALAKLTPHERHVLGL